MRQRHFRDRILRNKPVPTSPNERHEGFSGLVGPESYNLIGWENRVTESLSGMIKMYVEDTHHLPSANEYAEMAQQAIETTSRAR